MLRGPGPARPEAALVSLPFPGCVVGTVLLPLLGLASCILISSLFHFHDATGTHCQVANYLPSISASISLSPECHIWRLCISLHSAPRLLVALSYFQLYRSQPCGLLPGRLLRCAALLCALTENFGLLLLTYVSSNETYFVHKEGFVLFLGGSLLYMTLTCHLWRSTSKETQSPEDVRSFRWKIRCLFLNVAFCFFAAYFYWKHNMYCEPGSYTFFALFEYLVVISNMAFHLSAVWDFRSREVLVVSAGEDKHF